MEAITQCCARTNKAVGSKLSGWTGVGDIGENWRKNAPSKY